MSQRSEKDPDQLQSPRNRGRGKTAKRKSSKTTRKENSVEVVSSDSLGTRDKIKDVAQQLIAQHGVDGVSIREIVTAAGQRNMASLYYYFRTKDELIKELMVDAAKMMEAIRAETLAQFEATGEPLTIRQIAHVLIPGAKLDPTKGGREGTVMRFINAVMHTHRHLLIEGMGDPHNKVYKHCLELLRNELQHIPLAVINQRLLFFNTCCTSLLVAREEGLRSEGRGREYWSQPGTYVNILDFMCAGLSAPVTQVELHAQRDESTAIPPPEQPFASENNSYPKSAPSKGRAKTGAKSRGSTSRKRKSRAR